MTVKRKRYKNRKIQTNVDQAFELALLRNDIEFCLKLAPHIAEHSNNKKGYPKDILSAARHYIIHVTKHG
jgi:hypothetical protein